MRASVVHAVAATGRVRSALRRPGNRILTYHRLRDRADGMSVSPTRFREHLDVLRSRVENGFLTCVAASEVLSQGSIPWAALTFDDAWGDAVDALSAAVESGLPMTVYATPQLIGKRGFASTSALRDVLAAGVELGSHTMTHPDLTHCTSDELIWELEGSKKTLEDTFGVPVRSLAYPSGRFDPRVRRATYKAGYELGFGSQRGAVHRDRCDPYALPRTMVENFGSRTFEHVLAGGTDILWLPERLRGNREVPADYAAMVHMGSGGPPEHVEGR